MKPGFSFQAGAGGTALSFSIFLAELMRKEGLRALHVPGGLKALKKMAARATGD